MKNPRLRGSLGAALILLCTFLAWSGGEPVAAPPAAITPAVTFQPPTPVGAPASHPTAAQIAITAAAAPNSPVAQFAEWSARYLAAPAAERAALLAEGRELAAARREVMAKLIRTDPRRALASAVPMVVRQQLPAEIVALLEERVSGRGELALDATTPRPGEPTREAAFRTALVDGREFRAHVFGRRDVPASVQSSSMNGIALDGHFAVAESPLRVLEAGEIAADRPLDTVCGISGTDTAAGSTTPLNLTETNAVEYNGVVHVLCGSNHLAAIESRLRSTEESPLQGSGFGGDAASGTQRRPPVTWTQGPKKLLIIRVDFSDKPGTPVDYTGATMTEDWVAGIVGSVKAFYTDNSFGKTSLVLGAPVNGDSPDITPVLRMPQPSSAYAGSNDNPTVLHQQARDAAQAAGFDVASYDRIGVVFSGLNYPWAGLGNVTGPYFWINASFDLRVVAHEIGHNYGLWHANFWQAPPNDPTSLSGTSVEYGDAMDIMGSGTYANYHFSHWNKNLLQWIPDTAVATVTTSGMYRVYRLDDGAADLSLPRTLKIRSDEQRDFWIGYRGNMPIGTAAHGAYVLWGYRYSTQGNLLNLSGRSSGSSYDAPLPLGQTFTAGTAGFVITPIQEGGTGADRWLDIHVGFPPSIHWSQTTEYVVGEQEGSVTLTLLRGGDKTTSYSSIDYATVDGDPANGGAVAGSDYTAQSGTLAWAPGDDSPRTITIPILSDSIVEGGERFTVVLKRASGNATMAVTGNSTATVNITDRDVRDFSFGPLDVFGWVRKAVVLPDGNMLLGGSFQNARDSEGDFHAVGGLAKVTNDGRYLPEFSAPVSGGESVVYDLETQADGKIIVAGSFSAVAGAGHSNLARLLPDGTVDASFNASANGTIFSVVVQADGKILLGGAFTQISGVPRAFLARLNADGSVDPDFIPPPFAPGNWSVRTLVAQPDGRILVGGAFSLVTGNAIHSHLCRVLANGSVDESFNTPGAGGMVRALALLSNGWIMVGGEFQNFGNQPRGRLARLTASGELDPTFAVGLDGPCDAFLPLADGRLVIGGVFTHINGIADDSIAILLPNDSVDTYFASIGGFQGGEVSDILMLPNGRLQFCGSYQPFQYNQTWSPVWRFMSGVPRPPGFVQFTAATASGDEGGTVTVTANRIGGSGAISVNYATADDSATAADYAPASGTLTWADGDTSPRTITIALNNDSLTEADETFFINLGSPLWGGANLGAVQRQVITIRSTNTPPPPPPPPPGTWQDGEVGAVGAAGSSNESNGTITVSGSGADIAGTADAFHFRAQQLTGDGAIVARVASAGNTHVWAKAGIMFREDLTAGSREVMNFVTPGGHSTVLYRVTPGGDTALAADTWWGAPDWLMLVRTGDSFAGYHSGDGSNWTPIGTVTCVMPATIYVGLAVSSHDNTALNTATFDNVSIIGTNPPPPPPEAPAAPTNLMTSGVTTTTASLRWTDNASTETGFSFERAPGNTANFAVVGTAAANSTTWTDSGLSPNTAYTYRLRAVRDGVYSGYSNTFTIVTSDGPPPPAGWQSGNIGVVGPAGSETVAGDTITVNAGGQDIWDRADGFRFVYQQLSGDGEIKARVARLDNTNAWAKAGLMFRETLAAGARHVSYVVTADNTSGLVWRAADGDLSNFTTGPWVNAPYWIRLVRSGNVFTASVSPDGTNWTVAGTQTLGMAAQLYVGLAVCSHDTSLATTAVFEHVSMPTNPPPPPPPPPAWTQTAWAATGTFTSSGTSLGIDTTGADIWNQFDAGLFVSKAWHGDGEIIARVDSMTNTNPWAKAGLMFRQTTDAASPNVCVALTPTNGAIFQARTTSNGVTNEVQHSWLPGAPCWLKLTRTGDTFTAAFSFDGTTWTSLGSQTLVMPVDILVGFGTSSHASASINATFSGVTLH